MLLFHGSPGAAVGWMFADGPAREVGVRAVAPDRPGIGASSFQPDRRLVDYPADVATLADGLGIGEFAVLGWSAGGPYALARLPGCPTGSRSPAASRAPARSTARAPSTT